MRCPKCGCEESKVVDSRPSESNDAIRRRRECTRCGFRFTTYERCEETPLLVVKKDGHKETFDRQKLMRGLVAATVKRDIPINTLNSLIDGIFDGDYIIVKEQHEAHNGEIVVALIDDSATVKTFYREKDRIRLQPENDSMEPIYADNPVILGRVCALVRSM